jgi:hypothetical protein
MESLEAILSLLLLPFKLFDYLGISIPDNLPILLDIDVCYLHVAVHVAQTVIDDSLVYTTSIGDGRP